MIAQVATLLRYRMLIQSLVGRELKARYRGSILGLLLELREPAAPARSPTGSCSPTCCPGVREKSVEPYFLFLFCGILPWTWFQSSVAESSGVLIAGGNLIKKVLFPAEVLPVVTVLANMVHFLLGLPILLLFLLWNGHLSRHRPPAAAAHAGAARVHPRPGPVHLRAHRALPRHPEHPRPTCCTSGSSPPPCSTRCRRRAALHGVLRFNPMAHVLVSYQEMLFVGTLRHRRGLLLGRGGRAPGLRRRAPGCSTACATPWRRRCDGAGGGRRARRHQGLPALPPPEPVPHPEERAPHRQPALRPRAPTRPSPPSTACRSRCRGDRTFGVIGENGSGKSTLLKLHGRHHPAHPRLHHRATAASPPSSSSAPASTPRSAAGRTWPSTASCSASPAARWRSASTTSWPSPSWSAFIDAPVKTYSSGHVHAPRLRGGHPRGSRRAAHRRGPGGGRRGLHPQVPGQDRRVPPAREDHRARHPQPGPGGEDVRRRALAAPRPQVADQGDPKRVVDAYLTYVAGGEEALLAREHGQRRRRGAARRRRHPASRCHDTGTARAAGAAARSRSPPCACSTTAARSATSTCPGSG